MEKEEKIALVARQDELWQGLNSLEAATAAVEWAVAVFGRRAALSSSLSYEDQVLTDLLVKAGGPQGARIFTLDTGRQFPETYELMDRTQMRYGISLEVFFPDFRRVQEMVRAHGVNLFYDSIDLRHLCCEVRKVEPLKRALEGVDVWITGLRCAQSVTRAQMRIIEYDEADDVIKLNPLATWSEEEVKSYIRTWQVPYNKLHDKGFPSIGCQPCTRAVQPGDDIRSGRWWWEAPDKKECGLHSR